MPRDIEQATSYEKAIPIIDHRESLQGLKYLRGELEQRYPDPTKVSVVPILRGGIIVGKYVARKKYQLNPMQMSHTNSDNTFSPFARCLQEPDYKKKILRTDGGTNAVAFTDAVAESQDSILRAMEVIRRGIDLINANNGFSYAYPEFLTLILAAKFGDNQIEIPGLINAFDVNPGIWLFGWGCDDKQRGRKVKQLMGTLSPYATEIPQKPYY